MSNFSQELLRVDLLQKSVKTLIFLRLIFKKSFKSPTQVLSVQHTKHVQVDVSLHDYVLFISFFRNSLSKQRLHMSHKVKVERVRTQGSCFDEVACRVLR